MQMDDRSDGSTVRCPRRLRELGEVLVEPVGNLLAILLLALKQVATRHLSRRPTVTDHLRQQSRPHVRLAVEPTASIENGWSASEGEQTLGIVNSPNSHSLHCCICCVYS